MQVEDTVREATVLNCVSDIVIEVPVAMTVFFSFIKIFGIDLNEKIKYMILLNVRDKEFSFFRV